MAQLNYSDFYQVPDLKFDIKKLRESLDIVLKKRNFNSSYNFNRIFIIVDCEI